MLKFRGRRHGIDTVTFSADGRYLAASGWWGGVHIWDSHTQQLLAHFPVEYCNREMNSLAFLPDDYIFMPNFYMIGVGHLPTKKLKFIRNQHADWIAPHPDGRSFLIAHDRQLKLFDLNDTKPVPRWSVRRSARTPYSRVPIFFPDGSQFATLDHRNTIYWLNDLMLVIRRASDGSVVQRFPHPSHHVTNINITPDGQRLMTFAQAGLWLWDFAQTPVMPRHFAPAEGDEFLAGALHPSGTRFATVGNDRLVRLWDTETFQPRETFEWNIGKINNIAFSADGYRAVVGSSRGVALVWDVE